MYATMRSIGAYAPEKTITNRDFEKMFDTSDEWITKRTGIKERRIAAEDEQNSDMAYKAAKIALQRANLEPDEIDAIIVATISPDYFNMPATACLVAEKLGIKEKTAFDISAACSGFVYSLSIAKAFIESGMKKHVLIIGSEKLSAITDYSDRSTAILFGDGAGAAVISATDKKEEAIIDVHTASDGEFEDLLITPGCGSKNPCSPETLAKRLNFMRMSGNEVFKIAVRTLSKDVEDILAKNGMHSDQIDHFVPHQANYRIIKAVGDHVKFDPEKTNTVLTVHKYGNTSAASIPMAINDTYEEGKLKNGQTLLLDTFGGGFTWGSAIVKFSGN
jgi:3-oxoacyl-[acyl-carrier-protein] synthase-3